MSSHPIFPRTLALSLAFVSLTILTALESATATPRPLGGDLRILSPEGQPLGACPLERTEVEVDIVGYVARVRVVQKFYNPTDEKIEAIYVFPLPEDGAVDDMTMTVGDRRIAGQIKPRKDARRIYEAAKRAGHVASLLDQERPNIFTQSVANIEPGARVEIEISYVHMLQLEDGFFEFVFPMVVGPRYMPGLATGKSGTGWAPDTTTVPDASRISPPVTPPETRAGHDISVRVSIDAGTELFNVHSALHQIEVTQSASNRTIVELKERQVIPNKDFILRYRTATDEIGDAFLVHTDSRGVFFTLALQPPRRVRPEAAMPKEMIFVIDRSGSMSGFPIEKAKETMRLCIERMNPNDTFNLISFSGGTGSCFEGPVPNTPETRRQALRYLRDLHGSGGTEMMTAIRAALDGPRDPERLRIVCFMTDGYIGNDFQIIDAVKRSAAGARVFSFGIGNSVNRFLLDGMADAGRGEVEYVTLQGKSDGAAERFQQRIDAPVLTDIEIDWGSLEVEDVYPQRIPDLFSHKPIMIHGRLTGPAVGSLTLRGNTADGRFERDIQVVVPEEPAPHDALASMWARAKVHHLMNRDLAALQSGTFPDELEAEITDLGVNYRLVTQFTSFVAVEEMTITVGGEPRTITVPVEMPDGVSYEGVFGGGERVRMAKAGGQVFYNSASKSAPRRLHRLGRGQLQSRPTPAAIAAPQQEQPVSTELFRHEDEAANDRRIDRDLLDKADRAEAKLAPALRGLARKVREQGAGGNLELGGLSVRAYRVHVMIYLDSVSTEVTEALRRLGFILSGESKTIPLLIGSVDVRRLKEIAELEAVVRVTPLKP